MRPPSFRSEDLRSLLLRARIATLDQLKESLGTSVDITVFRKLKPLDYLTSFSHRCRYYTVREIARFDDHGLWSRADVGFSCSSGVTSKPAIEGHFKTGQRDHHPGRTFLPYRPPVWQAEFDPVRLFCRT